MLCLPDDADLERFRRDARRLQRAVRARDPEALALWAEHHPEGAPPDPATARLAGAQLVVARAYGFASWPRLRAFLDRSARLGRRPDDPASDASLADRIVALACLTYTDRDDPARWAEAEQLLTAHPELPAADVHVAAVAGDAAALRTHLEHDPGLARRDGGPRRWAPLLSVVYSRVRQADALGSVRVLLDAGADPNAGFLWRGLTPPFTVLTGIFGEGEQGSARQPRHPAGEPMARLLLDAGADVHDAQGLYNRMFGRDDGHLELLFAYGLGTRGDGVWRGRLGDALETVEESMQRQVDWATEHGLRRRLALLATHGWGGSAAPVSERAPSVHEADEPGDVAAAVAAGARVDERRGGRTALHEAAWAGRLDLVEALLAAGADPTARDDTHGGTPADWADHARQDATARRLRTGNPDAPLA